MDDTTQLDAPGIANGAAAAIRALNHSTLPANGSPGLTYPSDAYRTLGALSMLADRLPQVLRQVASYLMRELQMDHVDIDGGAHAGDPMGAIGTAASLLDEQAVRAARQLAAILDDAQQAIAFASYTGPDVEQASP
jgi:hypothetical protein